jgi:hypothetical protein
MRRWPTLLIFVSTAITTQKKYQTIYVFLFILFFIIYCKNINKYWCYNYYINI